MKVYIGTYDLEEKKWLNRKGDLNVSEKECKEKGLYFNMGVCFDIPKEKISLVVGEGHRDISGKLQLIFYAIMEG